MKKTMTTIAALMLAASGFAQLNGSEVMNKVYELPSGTDQQGQLTMTLVHKSGEKRVRSLQQFSKKTGMEEKKVMFFLAPADVRGTSFMNWSYSDGRDDDQWIYLPALKRSKRLSSDSKSDAFMGSDFTYDDLGERHPSKDQHTLLREERVGQTMCYVVQSKPVNPKDTYSKTISWVVKDVFVGLKKEFYDQGGRLLKVLTVKKYDKIDGYWTILETEMHNVQKQHKTEMKFEHVQYDQGIPDSKFTERGMTL